MSQQTIEIVVSPQGQTRIEAKGFTGGACRAATQRLEQALGARTAEQLKAEFHLTEQAAQHCRDT